MKRTLLAGASAAILVVETLSAQQPAPQAPPPVFRSGVNLVLVDVVVRDRSGAMKRNCPKPDRLRFVVVP